MNYIPQKLNPIGCIIRTIGAIPTSYLVSLTYEEQLMWLCDYLQNTVIPTINNNANAITEIQNIITTLQNSIGNVNALNTSSKEIVGAINELKELINEGTITIDSELSNSSENAVQNKVITNKINQIDGDILNINADIGDVDGLNTTSKELVGAINEIYGGGGGQPTISVDSALSPTSTNPVQNRAIYNELTNKENVSNKVTSISSLSTNDEYPTAKCVFDIIGDVESILATLTTI